MNRKDDLRCCICGKKLKGYGNNANPYKNSGECCDRCNSIYVIPARLQKIK